MKSIYILRHAKAGKSNKKILDDHERPLTKKGLDACSGIANYLKKKGVKPDLIITSTAKRARKTVENVFKENLAKLKVITTARLYLARPTEIMNIVNNLDNEVSTVLVVGHNPGLHEFVLDIIEQGEKSTIRDLRDKFPPGALAALSVKAGKWNKVSKKTATLVDYTFPKSV